MSLHYGNPKRWSNRQIVQYLIAFVGLIVALTVLCAWLYIGYRMDNPPEKTDPTTTTYEEELSVGRCLVILNTEKNPHYLLVQTDPTNKTISILDIPANLAVGDTTLKGSTNKKAAVKEALGIPVDHHITLDEEGIRQFMSVTDGVFFSLPETITYRNESGLQVRLNKTERSLTGQQMIAILSYTKWKKEENQSTIAAQLVAAMFDQYLDTEHNPIAYFRSLSDCAQTDLRIDNYYAYSEELTALAEANQQLDRPLTQVYTVEGTVKNKKLHPDINALRKESDFYP